MANKPKISHSAKEYNVRKASTAPEIVMAFSGRPVTRSEKKIGRFPTEEGAMEVTVRRGGRKKPGRECVTRHFDAGGQKGSSDQKE